MKIRALVFEDDESMRELLALLLEKRGYEVMAFSDPTVCNLYTRNECPCQRDYACSDIIITDVEMPRMTGLELLEHQARNGCKALPENKAVISGIWTPERREEAERLGCRTFEKPFPLDDLDKWLDECEKRIAPGRKLTGADELTG